jgi:HPt (histidine-containing phosphotransfer) domain-containing protein
MSEPGAGRSAAAAAGVAPPGIDMHELSLRCGGKALLMLKVLRRFVVEHEDFGAVLEHAAVEGQEPLARRAHRLKGAAAVLAMSALSESALRLEKLAEQGASNVDQAAAMDAVVAQIGPLLDGLKCWIEVQERASAGSFAGPQ